MKKINIILSITTTIIFSFLIYTYALKIELYNVKNIKINGTRFIMKNEIHSMIAHYKNDKINSLEIKEIQGTINMHPYIKASKIYKILPNTIIINIKEVVPIALFEDKGKYYFLDSKLNKIQSNINSINYYSVPIVSNKIKNDFSNIVQTINQIRKKNMKFYNTINEIVILEDIILFSLNKGTKIKINRTNEYNNTIKLLSFLETIKNNKNITDYKYVDLTIPKQIIVKENNKL